MGRLIQPTSGMLLAWAFRVRSAPDVSPELAEWDLTNGSFIATCRHDTLLEATIGDGLIIETVENE